MANFVFAPQSMCDTSSFKSCFPFTEIDFVNQYTELQSIILDNSNSNMIGICSNQDDGLSKNFANDINNKDCTGSLINPGPFGSVLVDGIHEPETKATKRKNTAASESSSGLSFEEKAASKSNSGRGKRGKRTVQNSSTVGGEVQKPKEVIHVRARKGQATDSHSLAEKMRREKMNERMRWLQDLVPGCYKTMGTVVMLDEIINYVQSLQNQVEFLSIKLSAASCCYDFNTGIGSADEMHQVCNSGRILLKDCLLIVIHFRISEPFLAKSLTCKVPFQVGVSTYSENCLTCFM